MGSPQDLSLFDQVVSITDDYLGPAAGRFVARQVENHLHKTPDKLTANDLLKLIDWIRAAVSLLTDDSKIIDGYITALLQLAKPADIAADQLELGYED